MRKAALIALLMMPMNTKINMETGFPALHWDTALNLGTR